MGRRQSRSGLDRFGYSKGRHLKDRRNLYRPARDQKRTAEQEVVRQCRYRQELHRADDASDLTNAYSYSYSYSYSFPDSHSYADANASPNSNSDTHAHTNSESNTAVWNS